MKYLLLFVTVIFFLVSCWDNNSSNYSYDDYNNSRDEFIDEEYEDEEEYDYDDGYEWAQDNDIDSFDDCDYEFWSSYWWAEDGCNDYVQEEHYTFDTTFWDYECTEDCSGHEAGYEWADDNWIDDEDDCWNTSLSFEEGCLQYIEDNN